MTEEGALEETFDADAMAGESNPAASAAAHSKDIRTRDTLPPRLARPTPLTIPAIPSKVGFKDTFLVRVNPTS